MSCVCYFHTYGSIYIYMCAYICVLHSDSCIWARSIYLLGMFNKKCMTHAHKEKNIERKNK